MDAPHEAGHDGGNEAGHDDGNEAGHDGGIVKTVMPRLVRGISCCHHCFMPGGSVYIMTNKPNGTLYVGVTGDICRRAWEHREGLVEEGFTKRYGLKRLVYAEPHEDIRDAIRREKRLKHWPRQWKINLIQEANPQWKDLYDTLA